jgi:hypothetical protein
VNSFCATETIAEFLSKMIALELLVPWSRDKIYLAMAIVWVSKYMLLMKSHEMKFDGFHQGKIFVIILKDN